MQRARELRDDAVRAGDQPYGAVVLRGEQIVGLGPSRVVTSIDPTAHAEMEALRDAARRLATRDLGDCVLVSTSRPCRMCEAAASWARISRMFYGEALTDGFRTYQQRVVHNARTLAEALVANGFDLVSGGTDNHLMLLDLRRRGLTGKVAEEALHHAHMTVNKNAVPNDPQKPWVTSGIRLGTPALTTRGFGPDEMTLIAGWIAAVLEKPDDHERARAIGAEVRELSGRFPLFAWEPALR